MREIDPAASTAIRRLLRLAAQGFSRPSRLALACRYAVEIGGKQIRPALLLEAAKVGPHPRRHVVFLGAAGIELLHLAALLHDDVIDRTDRRRGARTVRAAFGDPAATLAGGWLFARCVEFLSEPGKDTLISVVRASCRLCRGELREIHDLYNPHRSHASYFAAVDEKTATLFSLAAGLGARLSGADQSHIPGLEAYGRHLGIAFQVADDVLDLVGDPQVTGKASGADLRQGIYTLPVIYASEASPELQATLDGTADCTNSVRLAAAIRAASGIERAVEDCRGHLELARREAARLPHGERLASAADWILDICAAAVDAGIHGEPVHVSMPPPSELAIAGAIRAWRGPGDPRLLRDLRPDAHPFLEWAVRRTQEPPETHRDTPIGGVARDAGRGCEGALDDVIRRASDSLHVDFPLLSDLLVRELVSAEVLTCAATPLLVLDACRQDPDDRARSAAVAVALLALLPATSGRVSPASAHTPLATASNRFAVLASELVLTQALRAATHVSVKFTTAVTSAARSACEGQMLEFEDIGRGSRPAARYFAAAADRRGTFLGLAARAAGELGGFQGEELRRIESFGRALGMVVHLASDVDAVCGGSEGAAELRRGIQPLPVVYACEESPKLRQTVTDPASLDVDEALAAVADSGGIRRALVDCEQAAAHARETISATPFRTRESLHSLVEAARQPTRRGHLVQA